ncbi:MAG: hypothetical protein ACM3NH_04330 [Candidatus Saccharibacteria bacterium]
MIFAVGKLNWIGLARGGLLDLPRAQDLPPATPEIDPGKKPFLTIVDDEEETGELLTVRDERRDGK